MKTVEPVDDPTDPAILRARELHKQSGMTFDQLGRRMGYGEGVARRAAWQFLNMTTDPRLSMLRRFAKAVGVPVSELVGEPGKKGGKGSV